MSKNYLIIDHNIKVFLNDQILDQEYASQFPGATVLSCLARQAREHGWDVHTADVFLKDVKSFKHAVCISNEFTQLFHQLLAKGVMPGLLISGESPNVARQFYRDLHQGSSPFAHAYLFRGSIQRISPNCSGHNFLWPCPARLLETDTPWNQRSLLCMVASYKKAWPGIRTLPKQILPLLSWKISQYKEQSLQLKDLYPLRIKLARQFGSKKDFLLYGHGWADAVIRSSHWWRRKFWFANIPSSCNDKLVSLGNSRFSLIIENCIYPGYVTEKIFDAFRAGAVPVYLGAPDISDFVPSDCFIDYREFVDPDSLWNELTSISETRWNQYRQAIADFMKSPQYQQHIEENVARKWLDWIEEVKLKN